VAFAYLDLGDYLLIAEAVLAIPAEVLARSDRVIGLAESALAAPAATFGGEEFFSEIAQKAAVLCPPSSVHAGQAARWCSARTGRPRRSLTAMNARA
jgi:hypothetical protein